MPRITGLATTSALNTVENKIPIVSDLIKKTEYDATISDIKTKYFTTSDYNKFTSKILNTKIKEKGLVNKSTLSFLVKNSGLNAKLTTLATRAELKVEQGKTLKFQVFDLTYFGNNGKIFFGDNDFQNVIEYVIAWKSKGLFKTELYPLHTVRKLEGVNHDGSRGKF